MTRNYLEMSEEAGAAHKFYEVTVDGPKMAVRYGRIGTDGHQSISTFSTAEIAHQNAMKKINAKLRKGYAPAEMGVRKKRPISRRSIQSTISAAMSAPVLWRFRSGSAAYGIYVDDNYCWLGNQQGRVFKLDHQGKVINQYQLPDGIKCIMADQDWIYAGCDDGNVYDLTGKVARKAYRINENVDIYWLDINNGLLGVSDRGGSVTVINYEEEEQWSQKSKGSGGWMVRCDEKGRVLHGHSAGLDCYDGHTGRSLWKTSTQGSVLFGWRTNQTALTGSARGWLELFDYEGKKVNQMKADSALYSCAAAPDNQFFFGGDSSSSVYCYDRTGKRLWKLGTTCGSAYSMQYHKEKLYIVTTDGSMTCIDASPAAIEKAQQGIVPTQRQLKAPQSIAAQPTNRLQTAPSNATGVRLVCRKIGGKLRMRVLSNGFDQQLNVQFPYDLREENAEYLVDEVRPARLGDFYRAYGNIYKLS